MRKICKPNVRPHTSRSGLPSSAVDSYHHLRHLSLSPPARVSPSPSYPTQPGISSQSPSNFLSPPLAIFSADRSTLSVISLHSRPGQLNLKATPTLELIYPFGPLLHSSHTSPPPSSPYPPSCINEHNLPLPVSRQGPRPSLQMPLSRMWKSVQQAGTSGTIQYSTNRSLSALTVTKDSPHPHTHRREAVRLHLSGMRKTFLSLR